ncbi:MAG: FAD-dependent oxidoreductase, partial [Candidatus Latescibacteria bacterium]|nr:FAD-dependent oxidoreductase [Candidatus Latescibacterota bacterium]
MNNLSGLVEYVEPIITTETKPQKCLPASEGGSYDVIIIGGGPAGISSGVYVARKQINTLIITPYLGGHALWSSWVEKYPGYDVISGWNLATHLREQLEQQPVHIKYNDHVTAVRISNTERKVITKLGSEYTFKSLIVATGKRSKPLDVPGEKKFAGRGVTYCTTSDAPYYRDKTVSVIGGGNSALAAVNELLALGCTVNLVHHAPSLTAD